MARIYGIAKPTDVDPEYLHGLREAVTAALDYALASLELGEDRAPPVPTILLAQARLAARNDIGLDTVLRRYFAGYSLLHELLVAEAEELGLGHRCLKSLLRGQAALFDRLLAAISDEHVRESSSRTHIPEQRNLARIKRLLAGDLIDATSLDYDLEGFHLAIVGYGNRAATVVRAIARRFDRRLLLVHSDAGRFWAWLGSRRRIDSEEATGIVDAAGDMASPEELLSFGEQGADFHGWQLSHRQARAALPVAQAARRPVVRYADVTLLASVLQDNVAVTSLRELYLDPLRTGHDGGQALRKTLRAYFAAGEQTSSAASALGVTRHTVANRLRTVEERVGAALVSRAVELRTALLLNELDEASTAKSSLAEEAAKW